MDFVATLGCQEMDMLYIVMEYANGGDLGRRIQALLFHSHLISLSLSPDWLNA